jgi:hypothetical protein
MDFFTTPMEKCIEAATAESLREPDWGLNLAVCDLANNNRDK